MSLPPITRLQKSSRAVFRVVTLLYLYFALTPWAVATTSHASASVVVAAVVTDAHEVLDRAQTAEHVEDLSDCFKIKLTAEDDPDFPRADLPYRAAIIGGAPPDCQVRAQSVFGTVETRPPIG